MNAISSKEKKKMVYKLSELGRSMEWSQWKRIGGCGLSQVSEFMVCRQLGPRTHWKKSITLGDIEDAFPAAGREIARFAVEHLGRIEFAAPWES